jgi:hypothetical protein
LFFSGATLLEWVHCRAMCITCWREFAEKL